MGVAECRGLGETICQQLALEIQKLGFVNGSLPLPVYEQASFTQPTDPYTGQESVCGIWRGGNGQRLGEITFHADGSFYAEYDVARPHPTNTRWFVEAVVAWGRDDAIKTEARMLPALTA
jgi:hypothetical protein